MRASLVKAITIYELVPCRREYRQFFFSEITYFWLKLIEGVMHLSRPLLLVGLFDSPPPQADAAELARWRTNSFMC